MERIRELGLDELIAERRDGRGADPRHLPRPAAALRLDHRARRRRRARPARRRRSPSSSADGLKVPHIGWSPVRWERESRLTEGIESETPFYFVHSFAPRPERATSCSAAPPTAPASPARPSATTSSASSSTPRSRARPACGCSPTSPGSAPKRRRRRDPLSRRSTSAAARRCACCRATTSARRPTTPTRSTPRSAGPTKGPSSCTWSTSTGPRRASRGTSTRCGGSPPRSSARSRSAAACATRTRSPRCSTPGAERVVIGTAALRDPEFLDAALDGARRARRRLGRRPRRQGLALPAGPRPATCDVGRGRRRARASAASRASSAPRSRSTGRWRARRSTS